MLKYQNELLIKTKDLELLKKTQFGGSAGGGRFRKPSTKAKPNNPAPHEPAASEGNIDNVHQ